MNSDKYMKHWVIRLTFLLGLVQRYLFFRLCLWISCEASWTLNNSKCFLYSPKVCDGEPRGPLSLYFCPLLLQKVGIALMGHLYDWKFFEYQDRHHPLFTHAWWTSQHNKVLASISFPLSYSSRNSLYCRHRCCICWQNKVVATGSAFCGHQ
jgi:hypothetical protein